MTATPFGVISSNYYRLTIIDACIEAGGTRVYVLLHDDDPNSGADEPKYALAAFDETLIDCFYARQFLGGIDAFQAQFSRASDGPNISACHSSELFWHFETKLQERKVYPRLPKDDIALDWQNGQLVIKFATRNLDLRILQQLRQARWVTDEVLGERKLDDQPAEVLVAAAEPLCLRGKAISASPAGKDFRKLQRYLLTGLERTIAVYIAERDRPGATASELTLAAGHLIDSVDRLLAAVDFDEPAVRAAVPLPAGASV